MFIINLKKHHHGKVHFYANVLHFRSVSRLLLSKHFKKMDCLHPKDVSNKSKT